MDIGLLNNHVKLNNRPVSSKAGNSQSVITSKSTVVDNVIISSKIEVNPRPDSLFNENFSGLQDKDEMSILQLPMDPHGVSLKYHDWIRTPQGLGQDWIRTRPGLCMDWMWSHKPS